MREEGLQALDAGFLLLDLRPLPRELGRLLFDNLREELQEAFEFSNLYEKVANAAAEAAVDSLENILENGGRPEDLETLREQEDNIEKGISTILQDLISESTGAEGDLGLGAIRINGTPGLHTLVVVVSGKPFECEGWRMARNGPSTFHPP